jgi:hypothetical protein
LADPLHASLDVGAALMRGAGKALQRRLADRLAICKPVLILPEGPVSQPEVSDSGVRRILQNSAAISSNLNEEVRSQLVR